MKHYLILLAAAIMLTVAGLILLIPAHAQTTQPVSVQPDCSFFFTVTTTGTRAPTNGYDNRYKGCTDWAVTYFSSGFSAVTMTLQSAQDSSGSAGSWGTFSGTVNAGTNPMTSTTSSFLSDTGYNPWVSVLTATTGSGTIVGFAYARTVQPLVYTNAGGGSVAANVTVVAPLPLGVNESQLGGTALVPCTLLATANLSGSGNTQVIAASGSTTVRICHVSLSTTLPEDIKITQGTGSNCATPGTPADLTGLYKSVNAFTFDYGPYNPLTGSASQAICINQSAGQATGVTILYSQQ